MVTSNILIALQRHAEFLDTHMVFTDTVSFDRDPERKGPTHGLMLKRMSPSTYIELESASSKRRDRSLVMLRSTSNNDTYSLSPSKTRTHPFPREWTLTHDLDDESIARLSTFKRRGFGLHSHITLWRCS